jgi:hypothetical protein
MPYFFYQQPATADPPGYEDFFGKYRKMLKMGLPEGSIRNKSTQDGCSDEVMDYFFKNCTGGGGGGGGAPSPAPAPAPAPAATQPAAPQACLFFCFSLY